VRSARYRPIYKIFFWLLVVDCFILGYVGAHPPEGFLVTLGLLATIWYFAHFLIILPILGKLERPLPVPESLSTPVLGRGMAPAPAE
jgi:ubiquinol-cytochrome c reductase cytochrome b subunit